MLRQTLVRLLIFFLSINAIQAQLPDSCKLAFGTNLGGFSDYGTEISLKDRMKTCRTWYSKELNNPNGSPWNSEAADSLTYRPDGYPTHAPQNIPGRTYQHTASTIWAITDGWEPGQYVVLFDGTGSLSFWGGLSNFTQTASNRYTFDYNNPINNALEMVITESDINDPVRNIRLIKSEYESDYDTQPFNPIWLEKLLIFKSVRFMDYGHTNFWGLPENTQDWTGTPLADWDERIKPEYYTYTGNKGAPHELMIKLMNDYDLEGWVCVPHIASDDYINQMAQLFKSELEPQRHLTVEYSNEIWNWIFAQTHWCNHNGCIQTGVSWPEGIVPYVQNCLDIWSNVYGAELPRITRAVGLQAGWLDVSQRITNNMTTGSFDAVSPTFYFGFTEAEEANLDNLGTNCTVADVATAARNSLENSKMYLRDIKTGVADVHQVPMVFYEGGQHLTPNPFGVEPTYAQALIDIQRDTALYAIYNDWFDFLRTLQTGNTPLQLMNFSFISHRNARYGSWGILESMDQDTALVPAPKYKAVIENMNSGCFQISATEQVTDPPLFQVFPNPTCARLHISATDNSEISAVSLRNLNGAVLVQKTVQGNAVELDMRAYPAGVYMLGVERMGKDVRVYRVVKQ